MDSINDIVKRLREGRILSERKEYDKYPRDELIKMAQEGDQLAVETLINTHQDMIINHSKKYHLDTGDFDDVKQYVTIAFWEAVMNWDMTGNFEAYAGMIIKRKMTDVLRSESAEKTKISTKADELDAPIGSDDEGGEMSLGASIASSDLSPEEATIGKEGVRELLRFMRDKFSQTERDAVMMYIKGYKVSEIAEETGMKYKSVENALMRVKNKLTDYLRSRESKKIRESKSIEFSDEEKQILESILTKIDEKESIREARILRMKESYENYTESQLDKELDNIEFEIEDIVGEMRDTHYDDRDNLLDSLDDIRSKLSAMEEYLTDEQYKKSQDLLDSVGRAEDTEYEGEIKDTDVYKELGLRRSDFYK